MLYSEIRKWHWAISWDNPLPADSSGMLNGLASLGNVTTIQTKTTVILAPKTGVTWQKIRQTIVANLHPQIGNAFYVNLRSKNAFQWGSKTRHKWKAIT